jgi:hypothetical protein
MDQQTDVPQFDLGVTDADGQPLQTGDRVKVTGSDRFGEDEGTVIGAVCIHPERENITDYRIVDGELVNVTTQPDERVRIRVRLDNGVDGDDYTASQGRVTKVVQQVELG